jgi:hypothetical protein
MVQSKNSGASRDNATDELAHNRLAHDPKPDAGGKENPAREFRVVIEEVNATTNQEDEDIRVNNSSGWIGRKEF